MKSTPFAMTVKPNAWTDSRRLQLPARTFDKGDGADTKRVEGVGVIETSWRLIWTEKLDRKKRGREDKGPAGKALCLSGHLGI